jgi:hypothetical protein
MAVDRSGETAQQVLRPLTREEIMERLQNVASHVASEHEEHAPVEPSEPRWIRPADLVRRMRPYIVYN